ncbi:MULTISPECIES: anti-sigma factor [unclassified Pseudomonas]|uniref:anti-sigma factor n=1 Tax=unclassified Pseudomonas TaxID=196821 RepID=UPI001E657F8D|nr:MULTISPECIES: anti-sigma factor [unclassified Pseudomonas]MCE0917520.1 anti-sigma factor [Pseudomonas sp. NMI760_13]MCP8634459.1 anti-sigma factor [Pseudomonas sp. DVZ6]MDD7785205.1 anti-sigma factor [Pseudomonas sp. DVZ24]
MTNEPGNESTDDLEQLAGEYVLGTLSAEQQETVLKRLDSDRALRDAVDAWEQRLLGLNALATPLAPSPRLWQRINRSLGDRPAQPSWWRRLGLWQGLAGAGLAASLLLGLALLTVQSPATTYMVVLVAPATQAPGWVVQARGADQVQLIPLGKSEVPGGKVLQFWTKGEQWPAPISLGLIKPGEQVTVPLERLPAVEPNQLFELTLENAGGSASGRPNGPVQFIGRAVKVL